MSRDDEFFSFDDPLISPTAALFPDLSVPYDAPHMSAFAGVDLFQQQQQQQQQYQASMPSLSPASQAASHHTLGSSSSHSPRSAASPGSGSNFSTSVADDLLLGSSFSSSDLDLFLAQPYDQKPGQSIFLPQAQQQPQPAYQQPTFTPQQMIALLNQQQAQQAQSMQQQQQQQQQQQSVMSMPTATYQATQQHTMAPQWMQQSYIPLDHKSVSPQNLAPVAPAASQPKPANKRPKSGGESESPEGQNVGKHNKTERRYRQKVQAAQSDLRDAIPALRVLYSTSTEEQKMTTDIRAPDGTVDGLGEVTRPNASAKATILIGARMYIELLQRRAETLQRKVNELEGFRASLVGEDDLAAWQKDFNAREAILQAQLEALKQSKDDGESDDESDEEEDVPRKKIKPAPRGRPRKNKEEVGGVRVFAAFAMSFSLVPSASTLLRSHGTVEVTPGQVLSGKITPTQVISRLPLITAEHVSRLLARGLPSAVVPPAESLVDWSWRLLVGLVLVVLLGPLLSRFTKDEETPAGHPVDLAKDTAKLGTSKWIKWSAHKREQSWTAMAAGVLGGGHVARLHLIIHLHRTAQTAYAKALLALLTPDLPFMRSGQQIWQEARYALGEDAPGALRTVMALPLDEARASLELAPRTGNPIGAIAEQVTLVHLNDLFTRLFVHLVDATAKADGSSVSSVKSLVDNLNKRNIASALSAASFDREIRAVVEGVPKGSAAHALGLVLIGLWGVFSGPTPAAQAALASALAAEEIKGVGSGLQSVPAMLNLLFPGSSQSTGAVVLGVPSNALAIDKLALVCIDYVHLLLFAESVNASGRTRSQRFEASQKVQTATSRLRSMLTQTSFVGLLDDDEDQEEEGGDRDSETQSFDQARETLVDVLSVIGRRAAGRASADDDSGLDQDADEL